MSRVSLSEFQKLCDISDAACLTLLKEGVLDCAVDAHGTVMIELSSAKSESIVEALSTRREELAQQIAPELLERLSAQMLSFLEDVVDQAISQALAKKK